jgi:HD-GYP domain-containing protein (c-di-GMP phosphodiesterase class II)
VISSLSRQTVLVIADEVDVLRTVRDLLRRPAERQEVAETPVGLEILSVRPVHFFVADQRKLPMTGMEFLTRVRAEHAKMVRLLLATHADSKAVIHTFKSRRVYRRFSCARVQTEAIGAIHAGEAVQAFDTRREGWGRSLDVCAPETDGHSRRVSESGVRLARAMGMDETQLLHVRRGGLLHDIGKVGIPDWILAKPGRLTDEERDIIKRHPLYGYQLLAPLSFLQEALVIPHCHHERWDGTGYPRGFKGEEIPLAARIFAVIDVWDALCSDRPYRKAWPKHKARAYIRSLAGVHFDPRVVDRFLGMVM